MAHARKNSLWTPPAPETPRLLVGKTMAITGGVTGIGRAITLGYLKHGANVAVNHLGDEKSLSQFQSLVDEAVDILSLSKEDVSKHLVEVPGDVGNPETGKVLIKTVVDTWGRLDVVISNAGICEFKEFLECVCLPSFEPACPFVTKTGASETDMCQDHTDYMVANSHHQSHRCIQHYTSSRSTNVVPITPRRLRDRYIVDKRIGRWSVSGTLHANQGRRAEFDSIICVCPREVQYSMQCPTPRHDKDSAQ